MAVGKCGDHFLIYTTEEGGLYHVARCTPEEYAFIVANKEINVRPFVDAVITEPVYVALLCVVRDNHDFILGGARDEPETWKEEYRG
jgi:hypothetical protein